MKAKAKDKTRNAKQHAVMIRFDDLDYRQIAAHCKTIGATVTGFGRAIMVQASKRK